MNHPRLIQLIRAADILHIDGFEVDELGVLPDQTHVELRANGGDDRWTLPDQDVADFKDGQFTATDTGGKVHELWARMMRDMTLEDIGLA